MKLAIISDVHSNLEALLAVLADARAQGVSDIYCLGDVVGYGPNPCECVDEIIRSCRVCVMGNHDQAALFDPDNFNPTARLAVLWARDQLEHGGDLARANARWDFFGEMPRRHSEGDWLMVHGSPRDPINEYILPEDIYNPRKMGRLFELVPRYCFAGHTHIPGVFSDGEFLVPDEVGGEYHLTDRKVIINVGSVGQPRDYDPRASYAILDGNRVLFRRVEYPVEAVARKILAVGSLDKSLANRLRRGT